MRTLALRVCATKRRGCEGSLSIRVRVSAESSSRYERLRVRRGRDEIATRGLTEHGEHEGGETTTVLRKLIGQLVRRAYG